ncbi:MAG: UDP-N-acetylmuramoyl-L-alanine--D-glutamate ligase [Puniceicoccales bacterium]|jgi:UDP-N-acetylmuramoylalanine--D-glutamate ligase|nr:UDP-N-acetylmuramoyl-L-alanine--D-glutamate ligase [Puniceicoccales bacterium]
MDVLRVVSSAGAIGIFGGGVTGKAVAKFCENRGIRYKVFDEFFGEDRRFSEDEAAKYPLVVRSPSFMSHHEWVKIAGFNGCRCLTELEFASCFWHGKIVAVTGTNGKTTTVEFIEHALRLCGKKAVSCGNIGKTFVEVVDSGFNVDGGLAVVEVSSFQMEGSTVFHPDYVLWTNFADDHLDAHGGLLEYFRCKAKLINAVRGTYSGKTCCFVGKSVDDFARQSKADDVFGKYVVCTSWDALPKDSALNTDAQRENFALVQKFWQYAGLQVESLQSAAATFRLPPHRLQRVAKISKGDGAAVEFWNDSKATNFHALNGALKSFIEPVILIAGGKSKGEPIDGFLKIIRGKVKALLLIGTISRELCEAVMDDQDMGSLLICKVFDKNNSPEEVMEAVVRHAFSLATDGDIVLLSPGFSSLDWFESYEERGKFFEDSVFCLSLANE